MTDLAQAFVHKAATKHTVLPVVALMSNCRVCTSRCAASLPTSPTCRSRSRRDALGSTWASRLCRQGPEATAAVTSDEPMTKEAAST